MSRLPQPGDVPRASRALNQRFAAALEMTEDDTCRVGGNLRVNMTTGDVSGEGAAQTLMVYGDLFSIPELFVAFMGGEGNVIDGHIAGVESGEFELRSTLMSLVQQATAMGVLMERQRWERGS